MKVLAFYGNSPKDNFSNFKGTLDRIGLDVEYINAYDNLKLVDLYNICTVPMLIFLDKKGEEVDRLIRPFTDARIKECLSNFD